MVFQHSEGRYFYFDPSPDPASLSTLASKQNVRGRSPCRCFNMVVWLVRASFAYR